MIRCPSCSAEITQPASFCPACGAALGPASESPTETSAGRIPVPPPPSPAGVGPGQLFSTSSPGDARFLPGSMIGQRYRIIGLLGRGGMGEVYRADDLKLAQPVALKFLPEEVEREPARLERFLNEVRVALRVTHPNVCRVFDIGEVDGHHFLSMEYVDGEDLATLLRRIGRLPEDKATQLACQICAGLAAAHEQGILHRDLKPANVMIDGRGRARITDFGLAGLAEGIEGAEVRAGTPAYMAPEQLAGREVSVRSDVYSLGLVLYELFTGKRAFEARSAGEMARLQQETTPTTPTSHVSGLDPAVERIILRCLEREPSQRPASALAVAGALPGGDPLAAALAAGETPSPEMVAAAGDLGGLRPAVAVTCLVLILIGLVAIPFIATPFQLLSLVPDTKPPTILAERARELVVDLGYEDPPADTVISFGSSGSYLDWIAENDESARRWERLASTRPPALFVTYRQSPRPLLLLEPGATVAWDKPPLLISGMVNVALDPQGRLLLLEAVPPEHHEPLETAPDPDWQALFEAAGLAMDDFTEVDPEWQPLHFADDRAAWEGVYSEQPEIPIRVEAAAYQGRPVSFQIIQPWTRPARMGGDDRETREKILDIFIGAVFIAVLVGVGLLARRNLRLGRGDRKGAYRLGAIVFLAFTLSWALEANHVPDFWDELYMSLLNLAWSLYFGAITWGLYVALEPNVRRLWPASLISWSRLLAGRTRDPMVGRDILVGGLLGTAITVLFWTHFYVPEWLGMLPHRPGHFIPRTILGGRFLGSLMAEWLGLILMWAIMLAFGLLLTRVVLRRQWAAVAALVVIMTVPAALDFDHPSIDITFGLLLSVLKIVILLRIGLLAVFSFFFFRLISRELMITMDLTAWYSTSTIVGFLVLAAVAGYAFYISLAGRRLFSDDLLES